MVRAIFPMCVFLRNVDCFESSSDEGKCFCCLPHFVSTTKVTLELGTKHETWRNIVFRGRRFADCLSKTHPCTDYLDYYDWDLVRWFAERYSRLVPYNEDQTSRMTVEELEHRAGEIPTVPVQLRFDESLADMQSIVCRVISGECNESSRPSSTLRNRRARRSAARQRQQTRDPSPVLPRPEPPTQYPTWVFCVNGQWNRARLVDCFRPNTNYKLIWFHDGNMIRIHDSEFAKGELVRVQINKPDDCPDVSKSQIIMRQIYIYMCLDGFWEYSFPRCPNVSPSLFPYHNPIDPYEPPYGAVLAQVEDGITQLINSGKLELPTDVEKGDEIVSYIFNEAFDRLMNEREKEIGSADYSSSSSETSAAPIVEKLKSKKTQAPGMPAQPATGKYTVHNLPFEITLEPADHPEDIPNRKSGVKGIRWDSLQDRWCAKVTIAHRTKTVCFKPRSRDNRDVKDALELAKEHLRTVLLPQQAVHQLNSAPHGHFRFNPK